MWFSVFVRFKTKCIFFFFFFFNFSWFFYLFAYNNIVLEFEVGCDVNILRSL